MSSRQIPGRSQARFGIIALAHGDRGRLDRHRRSELPRGARRTGVARGHPRRRSASARTWHRLLGDVVRLRPRRARPAARARCTEPATRRQRRGGLRRAGGGSAGRARADLPNDDLRNGEPVARRPLRAADVDRSLRSVRSARLARHQRARSDRRGVRAGRPLARAERPRTGRDRGLEEDRVAHRRRLSAAARPASRQPGGHGRRGGGARAERQGRARRSGRERRGRARAALRRGARRRGGEGLAPAPRARAGRGSMEDARRGALDAARPRRGGRPALLRRARERPRRGCADRADRARAPGLELRGHRPPQQAHRVRARHLRLDRTRPHLARVGEARHVEPRGHGPRLRRDGARAGTTGANEPRATGGDEAPSAPTR